MPAVATNITGAQVRERAEMCSRAGVSQQQQHSRAMTLTVALEVAGLEMQLATAEDTALAVALGPAEKQVMAEQNCHRFWPSSWQRRQGTVEDTCWPGTKH